MSDAQETCQHKITTQRFHFYQRDNPNMSWWCTNCGALFLHDEVQMPNAAGALSEALARIDAMEPFQSGWEDPDLTIVELQGQLSEALAALRAEMPETVSKATFDVLQGSAINPGELRAELWHTLRTRVIHNLDVLIAKLSHTDLPTAQAGETQEDGRP